MQLVVWINADRYYVVSTVGVLVFGVTYEQAALALLEGGFDVSILDTPADAYTFKATMRQAFASELQRLNDTVDQLPVSIDDVRQRQNALAEQVGELEEELAEERRQQGLRIAIADLEHQLRLQEPFLRKVVAPGRYQEQDIAALLAGSPMAQRIRELRAQL